MKRKTFVVGYVQTNCYIVYDESKNAVMIDPGDDAATLLAFLAEESLNLKYIFLTHGHFDHILAMPEVRKATGAQVVIAEGDAECLLAPRKSLASNVHLQQEAVPADILAKDRDVFSAGAMHFTWLLTPGHTPGCAVILCENAMFSGDTLFEDDCGRCDLPGGDYATMLQSLRRLYALEGDYDVFPGHDVMTTLSRERKYNRNMLEAVEGARE